MFKVRDPILLSVLLKKAGMPQILLAQKLGISGAELSRRLNYRIRGFNKEEAVEISRAVGWPIDSLFSAMKTKAPA